MNNLNKTRKILSAAIALLVGVSTWHFVQAGEDAKDLPKSVEAGAMGSIYQVAPGLYCGAQPLSDEQLEALKKLGIQTVICLDGVRPLAKEAKEAGLTCLHIPVGFNNADTKALEVASAVQTAGGPVYLHCHYGSPRTPVIAGLVCRTLHGWDAAKMDAWLQQAGVPETYAQLAGNVKEFQPPQGDDLASLKLEKLSPQWKAPAKTPALAAAMGAILGSWDHLKGLTPENIKDVNAEGWKQYAQDARRVTRLIERSGETEAATEFGGDFKEKVSASLQAAEELQKAIRAAAKQSDEASQANFFAAMKGLGTTCGGCHKDYRN